MYSCAVQAVQFDRGNNPVGLLQTCVRPTICDPLVLNAVGMAASGMCFFAHIKNESGTVHTAGHMLNVLLTTPHTPDMRGE